MIAWVLLACTKAAPQKGPTTTPKNALVIVIDTARADVVAEVDTPNLDALAARGTSVERAWSSGTWTVPSVASLFTGMSVREHGWDLPAARIGQYPKLPDAPTLASVLQAAGFKTAALYANAYLSESLGFDRGFDSFTRVPDAAMLSHFSPIVMSWSDGKRHFAYVHLLGPHSPLKPSADATKKFGLEDRWVAGMGFDVGAAKRNQEPGVRDAYARAYRAVVEDTDRVVGELVQALGPYRDDTLVVVTSDHGELLGEHGVCEHGSWVWEQLTHVPLIVDRPIELPSTLSISSVPAIVTEALGIEHRWPTPSHPDAPALVSQREGKLAISDGTRKTIWENGNAQSFDLSADPHEENPLAPFPELDALRSAWEARTPAGKASMDMVTLSPDTRKALRALGYAE
jgi:hypothetical protein